MKFRTLLIAITTTALMGGSVIATQAATVTPLPAGASAADGYGIVLNPTVKKQIDIWEDFQCPYCHAFEGSSGSYINAQVKAKSLKVVYHMLSFVGPESVALAQAAGCASDAGKYQEFHAALFANQASSENSGKWKAKSIIDLGKKVGVTSSTFASCVNSKKYAKWVDAVENSANAAKVNSTPTVFLNGKEIDRNTGYSSLAGFKAIIEGKAAPVSNATTPHALDASKYITVTGEYGKTPNISTPKGTPPAELALTDLTVGTGATVLPNSTLTVHYELIAWSDGKIIDSSYQRGQQATFPLSGVIQGWQIGLVGAKEGGRRLLVIPPSLGYGSQASGPLKANETLVFVVDIYKVS